MVFIDSGEQEGDNHDKMYTWVAHIKPFVGGRNEGLYFFANCFVTMVYSTIVCKEIIGKRRQLLHDFTTLNKKQQHHPNGPTIMRGNTFQFRKSHLLWRKIHFCKL